MAVTVDKQIGDYYTWGSYPYTTWGGERIKTWGEAATIHTTVTDTDTLNLSPKFNKQVRKTTYERAKFAEALKRVFNANRKFNDSLKVVESYRNVMTYTRDVLETVKLAEKSNKSLSKLNFDAFKIEYTNNKSVSKKAIETILADEVLNRSNAYGRNFEENVYIGIDGYNLEDTTWSTYPYITWNGNKELNWGKRGEWFYKQLNKPFDEADQIYISEYYNKETEKNIKQQLIVKDTFKRRGQMQRIYDDTIVLLDVLIRQNNKLASENISIKDAYVAPCLDAIYSNIFITEGEFSDSDFENAISVAPGYTKFIDFKVGEYEYQDALVRIKVEAGPQAQPTAQGIVMHVDIPDTDDRGTARITNTNEPTPVSFNKFYYVVPEVQVTLRSANTSSGTIIPSITNITTTHFDVELLTTGGARTTGSISWVAKGY